MAGAIVKFPTRMGSGILAGYSAQVRRLVIGLLVALGATGCTRRAAPGAAPGAPALAPKDALWQPWAGLPVDDPWAHAPAGASARTRALEDLGPREPRQEVAGSPGRPAFVSTNAVYWTERVGLPFRRDVDLDVDQVPVDLDGDATPDTRVTRHLHLPGGILAHPEAFGLVPTPEDPAGARGAISASTGVLGLREELDDDGRPTGRIGMTCFLCHGARNAVDGALALGLANPRFDYGLLLATADVLGDAPAAVAHRAAHGFPEGAAVRARLLLAGPGRQDLTGEFGLDVTVPHASARYPGTARVRQKTRGVVNPLSVPNAFGVAAVDLQNWSGSEVASSRWLAALEAQMKLPEAAVLAAFALPPFENGPRGPDTSAARRALLLDLRNLGTLGLQQDSWPGLLFADAIYGFAPPQPGSALPRLHRLYAAADVRTTLAREETALARPRGDPAAVARGRRLFFDREAGTIANLRIAKEAPAAYASSHLPGPVLLPLFLGRPLGERLAVRCGDCHSATPHEALRTWDENPSPSDRCTTCHRSHVRDADPALDAALAARQVAASTGSLDGFLTASADEERTFCTGCHLRHRTFAPVAYSNSALLPFDADRDGRAQDDEADDAQAGGIGTEALLAFDVPRPARGAGGFHLPVAVIEEPRHAGVVHTQELGVPWVRVPTLVGVFATAPYLHNGAVPTLEALLTPPSRRPRQFALGSAGFVLDTSLPGNHASGHDFGTRWSARDKADVIAFLRSL